MTKKVPNQIYITQDEIVEKGIEYVLMASIGRKRSGVVRMRYYQDQSEIESDCEVRNLSTLISYKFKREMEKPTHQIEDRPTLLETLDGTVPWVGLVQLEDEVNDAKYRVEAYIRNMVISKDMVFQLRDLKDGSPYSEGLVLIKLRNSPDGGVLVDMQPGLKQQVVVEEFHGYRDALDTLKDYLYSLGYQQCPNKSTHLHLYHNGELVSTIDIALVGKVKL